MNEKWLNKLRDKLDGYSENPPEDLWKDIEKELFSSPRKKGIFIKYNKYSFTVSKKHIYTASIAILFFLILNVAFFKEYINQTKSISNPIVANNTTQSNDDYKRKKSIKDQDYNNDNTVLSSSIGEYNTIKHSDYYSLDKKQIIEKKQILDDLKQVAINDFTALIKQQTDNSKVNKSNFIASPYLFDRTVSWETLVKNIDKMDSTNLAKAKTDKQPLLKEIKDTLEEEIAQVKTRHKVKPFAMNLTTGQMFSDPSQQFSGYTSSDGNPIVGEELPGTPFKELYDDILLANELEAVATDVKYKAPITASISAQHQLTERLSFVYGLSYTKLKSQLQSGSANSYVKRELTLHYIGIPIQLNFNIMKYKSFTSYLTIGSHIKKAVTGSYQDSYTLHNQTTIGISERVTDKPLHIAARTSIGFQYLLTPKLSILAEPGIEYYFINKSSLETIYQKDPLKFNLNLGVRFMLSK